MTYEGPEGADERGQRGQVGEKSKINILPDMGQMDTCGQCVDTEKNQLQCFIVRV